MPSAFRGLSPACRAGVTIAPTCIIQSFQAQGSPRRTSRCPPRSKSGMDAQRGTNGASCVMPHLAPPPTPGPQQTGPTTASRMRFDPSISSEVSACGSETSCLPVVALRLILQRGEEKRLGLEAPRAGGGRRREGKEAAGGWLTLSASRRSQEAAGSFLLPANAREGYELLKKAIRATACRGQV